MDSITSIPEEAFEQFLKGLGDKSVSPAVIQRLRETLISKPDLSEGAITTALFSDNQSL
ncbi:MAG: hypothetical protein ACHQD8_02260 [Chitinophagales bacterium]